ncbi:helix-turn-helix transcriptional regulator [Erythrobacter mangrovi]|uniref:Helix-turn-helix transcriptional regulator n=2 Tax=Erythrobacter mangrovi TaxID=2739433 RepID=A0A7D4C6P9_9SPHN|nr:helix-turn-helix transcriptional regulator [Erythrobacter mangrovi]
MARASDLIGDRWIMLILREALYGVGCFADMQADLEISRSILTERLARLVDEGLLEKVTYQDPGTRPRQAYVLTSFGRKLIVPFLAIADWGQAITGEPSPLEMYDTATGSPLRLALVNEAGDEVEAANLGIRVGDHYKRG